MFNIFTCPEYCMTGIFYVHMDGCNCTWELCSVLKSLQWSLRKNRMLHGGIRWTRHLTNWAASPSLCWFTCLCISLLFLYICCINYLFAFVCVCVFIQDLCLHGNTLKLVAKSSVVPQWPSWSRDEWWWWWHCNMGNKNMSLNTYICDMMICGNK